MIDVLQAAQEVQSFLERQGCSFAFIGGLAVNRWGRARTTNDADVCLLTGFGGEAPVVDALLADFAPRIADARDFAIANRVLLLKTNLGFGVDISLGGSTLTQRSRAWLSVHGP